MRAFRGKLVLKEMPIPDVLLALGELPIPNKPGRVEWWGQCRLDMEVARAVNDACGEAFIELADGRRGRILVAELRRETGMLRFSGMGELKQLPEVQAPAA